MLDHCRTDTVWDQNNFRAYTAKLQKRNSLTYIV